MPLAADPPHETTLTVSYDDPDIAERVARSIAPEVGAIDGDRTTAALERHSGTVILRLAAADLVALRAGCNTWLTLVSVAESTAGDMSGSPKRISR